MKLQLLVSAMNKDAESLINTMGIRTDAVIINQCDKYDVRIFEDNEKKIEFYDMNERGVGRSRNSAVLKSSGDILLFSDEDIVYEEDYGKRVIKAFEENKDADMLIFNIEVDESRRTYHIDKKTKVGPLNCGRYPTYSMAVKRDILLKKGIMFSLLFGGGAPYSAGEDSLFVMDCVRSGMKIYALPVTIGREILRPSTWFNGYTEKFFYDRGVLFAHLYGRAAGLMAARYILVKKKVMCREIKPKDAYLLIKKGIKDGR
ncbi:MAG: glycosyltransferase family 2 protein [Lachnospiraceae bacterium]|nr:glycosyltransferase family 2 protein [Lachnospiraceae bacterium]